MKKPVYTKNIYPNHQIGDYTYGKPKILGDGELQIGRFCSIADGVTILLGVEHRSDWTTTYPFSAIHSFAKHIPGHPRSKGPIRIGNDVWIGQNATILSGVTIGNGAIIGANSVISRNVSPYAIFSGNPASFQRYRFDVETINLLLMIKWWDWPIEKIEEYIGVLLSPPNKTILRRFI